MTKPTAVTNAGPLIYLAVLDRFDLLGDLFQQIHVPEAVYGEVVLRGGGLPGASETGDAIRTGWLRKSKAQDRIAVDALLAELDLGEAEAIVLAREMNVQRTLLDDRAARDKAQAMGLTVTGTIGVLLLARDMGYTVNLQHDLDLLIQHNFRISPQLYQRLVNPQS